MKYGATLGLLFLVIAGGWVAAQSDDLTQDSNSEVALTSFLSRVVEVKARQMTWATRFKLGFRRGFKAVRQLPGGGFVIVAGSVRGPAILLIDDRGRLERIFTLSGLLKGKAWALAVAPDGSMILTGRSDYVTGSPQFNFIARLDAAGDITGVSRLDHAPDVGWLGATVLEDGGIGLVGYTYDKKVWCASLDPTGGPSWQQTLQRSGSKIIPFGICATPDGGVALVGDLGFALWVARLSSNGELLWSKTYGGSQRGRGHTIAAHPRGGFVVGGNTRSFGAAGYDGWVLRLDDNGAVQWEVRSGGEFDDGFEHLAVAEDGTIWVVGKTTASSMGARIPWLLHLSASGSVISQNSIDFGIDDDKPDAADKDWFSADATRSGGAVVAGCMGGLLPDLIVVTVDARGETGQRCGITDTVQLPVVATNAVVRNVPLESIRTNASVVPQAYEEPEGEFVRDAVLCAATVTADAQLGPEAMLSRPPEESEDPPGSDLVDTVAGGDLRRVDPTDMLLEGRFDDLDEAAAHLLNDHTKSWDGGWDLVDFYSQLDPEEERFADLEEVEILRLFEHWVEARPASVTARIALGSAYKGLAWRHRGGGLADTVTDQGWSEFRRLLVNAIETLEDARRLQPRDPHLYSTLLGAALTMGAPEAYVAEVFEEGMAVEPGYYWLYIVAAGFLRPQWGGDQGAMASFAATIADRLGGELGEEVYANIGIAWSTPRLFTDYGFEWPRLKAALAVLRERFPDSDWTIHASARIACLAKDRAAARELFELPGGEWKNDMIGLWRSRRSYEEQRRWALAPAVDERPGAHSQPQPDWLVQVIDEEAPSQAGRRRSGFFTRFGEGEVRLVTTVDPTVDEPNWGRIFRVLVGDDRWRGLAVADLSGNEFPVALQGVAGFLRSGWRYGSPNRTLALAITGDNQQSEVFTALVEDADLGRSFTIFGCVPEAKSCRPVRFPARMKSSVRGTTLKSFTVGSNDTVAGAVAPGAALVNELGYVVGIVTGEDGSFTKHSDDSTRLACEPISVRVAHDSDVAAAHLTAGLGGNDLLEVIVGLLECDRYDDVDRLADALAQSGLRFPDGRRVLDAYYRALNLLAQGSVPAGSTIDTGEAFRRWHEARPGSPRVAVALAKESLRYRPVSVQTTEAELRQAREEACGKALSLVDGIVSWAPGDPGLLVEVIRVIKSCQGGANEISGLFSSGIARHPSYEPLYTEVAADLGGRPGSPGFEAFAAMAASTTQDELGDMLYAEILIHRSPFRNLEEFEALGFDWVRLKRGLEGMIAAYSDSFSARANLVALACAREDGPAVRLWIDDPEPVCNGWSSKSEGSLYRSSGIWTVLGLDCDECRRWAFGD